MSGLRGEAVPAGQSAQEPGTANATTASTAASRVRRSPAGPRMALICQAGRTFETRIAADQASAAPVMPSTGTSVRFRTRLVISAAMLLRRLCTLRPSISSAMSTGPAAVPTSIPRARMTTTGAPDS